MAEIWSTPEPVDPPPVGGMAAHPRDTRVCAELGFGWGRQVDAAKRLSPGAAAAGRTIRLLSLVDERISIAALDEMSTLAQVRSQPRQQRTGSVTE